MASFDDRIGETLQETGDLSLVPEAIEADRIFDSFSTHLAIIRQNLGQTSKVINLVDIWYEK